MTRCSLHSDKHFESAVWFDAEGRPGVRYQIARVSFGRRIELARRIREIGRKTEYLEAGSDVREKLEAAVLRAEIFSATAITTNCLILVPSCLLSREAAAFSDTGSRRG